MPIRARARPSAIRLVPMVRMPMSSTGTTTGDGWMTRPMRFSLIIRPQSAAGGCRPKPRNESAAMRPIEYVRRRPNSTSNGLVMLGRISAKRIFQRATPSASAARTKSRCATSSVAARATRAMRGACEMPTMSTISQSLRPEDADEEQTPARSTGRRGRRRGCA